MTDTELIKDYLKCANQDSFSELWLKYKPIIRSLIAHAVPRAEVEDILQEVAVKVFRKLHQFEGRSGFSTWLNVIALNEVRLFMRNRKLKKNPKIELLTDDEFQFVLDNVPAPENQARVLYHKELIKQAQEVLDSCPETYRCMFIMCDGYQLNFVEAGAAVNITQAAAKSRLHRARERFIWKFKGRHVKQPCINY